MSASHETAGLILRAEGHGVVLSIPRGAPVVIGRRPHQVDLCIPDVTVASRHARVFEQGGAWYVEDLGSHCGIFINEYAIAGPHPIGPGDVVRIGGVRLTVEQAPGSAP